ncbi:LacI family DNA-binding transcriptional regulator [Phytoactinopolyspora endophytica]|uniref:LacI family DNA-binding transcriptional regulator n=1 Tax=Phytoactinopolyspora endophytica TaxID=1642495 RepID=UPI00101D1C73|nr:LacI family DNA-binding transcriptional regulator [Phytoactinopolyspora endophytica]
MDRTANRTTARDVAARAGVSPATVSKALSGKGPVHPETRERIINAARELNLRSSHLEPPRGVKPLTVGLLARESFNRRRTAMVVLSATAALAERDIALLAREGNGDAIREQNTAEALLHNVDGILVVGADGGSYTRPPLHGDITVPVVYVMASSTDPADICVVPDDRGGAELAIRHLLSTGRRDIACILGPSRQEAAKVKSSVTQDILREHGLTLAADPLFGTWDEPWGRQATLQLMHTGARVDGLICGNDRLARGAASALQALGRSVPEDVGIIGFDNWDVMVDGNHPRLSSIDLNLSEVGRAAATILAEQISNPTNVGGTTVIESHLVPRESTDVLSPVSPRP